MVLELPDTPALLILAGIIFIFLSIIGGKTIMANVSIPEISLKQRYILAIFGAVLLITGFLWIFPIPPPPPPSNTTPTPTQQCYYDDAPDITNHGIKLINISATCEPNPPSVNSRITIEFTLQNVGNEPITFEFTSIAARNPSGENKDIGYGENTDRTVQPQEIVGTKGSIIVDSKGIWKFGPAYSLKLPDGTTEGNPNEWRRFPVLVK